MPFNTKRPYSFFESLFGVPEAQMRANAAAEETQRFREDNYIPWQFARYHKGYEVHLPKNPMEPGQRLFYRHVFAPGYSAAQAPAWQEWLEYPIKRQEIVPISESFKTVPTPQNKKTASAIKQAYYDQNENRARINTTQAEADRRFSANPFSNSYLPEAKQADNAIIDAMNAYRDYLNWRIKNNKGLPNNVNTEAYLGYDGRPYSLLDEPTRPTYLRATQNTPSSDRGFWGGLLNTVTGGAMDKVDEVKGKAERWLSDGITAAVNGGLEQFDERLAMLPYPVGEGVREAMADSLNAAVTGQNLKELGTFDKNFFTTDAWRALKTDEERANYLTKELVRTGVLTTLGGKDTRKELINNIINDPSKLYELPQQLIDNPEYFDSLCEAAGNGNLNTLEFLTWAVNGGMQKTLNATGASSPAPKPEPNPNGAQSGEFKIKLSDEQKWKVCKAAAKCFWNSIKEDPIDAFPMAMSVFLKYVCMEDAAGFMRDPLHFYLLLGTALVGGGYLLFGGSTGGNNDKQQIIINNNSGAKQPDPRMQKVPYSFGI